MFSARDVSLMMMMMMMIFGDRGRAHHLHLRSLSLSLSFPLSLNAIGASISSFTSAGEEKKHPSIPPSVHCRSVNIYLVARVRTNRVRSAVCRIRPRTGLTRTTGNFRGRPRSDLKPINRTEPGVQPDRELRARCDVTDHPRALFFRFPNV